MEAVRWCGAASPSLGKLVITGETSMQSKVEMRIRNQKQSRISTFRKQPLSSEMITLVESRFIRQLQKLRAEMIEMPSSSPDTYCTLLRGAWPTQPHWQTFNKGHTCFAPVSGQAGYPHEEALTVCCGCVAPPHTAEAPSKSTGKLPMSCFFWLELSRVSYSTGRKDWQIFHGSIVGLCS